MIGFSQLLTAATLITAICMVLSGMLLAGFATHRLRYWNQYFTFSIAVLAAVRFVEHATGQIDERVVLACWINLAIGSLIGLVGVARLAKMDPPLWRVGRRRP